MANGNISIQTSGGGSTLGVIAASGFGLSFLNPLYRYANLTLPYSPNDPGLSFVYDNSTLAPVVLLYSRFFNLLNEASTPLVTNVGTSAFSVSGISVSGAQNCLDVRSFGAVGDGVADDTAAIQAALNQAYQNFLGNQITAGQGTAQATRPAQSIQGFVSNGSGGTVLLSLVAPTVSGNTIVLTFSAFDYGAGPNSPASPKVSDNAGNVYTQDAVVQNGELLLYTYHARVTNPQLTTITILFGQKNFNSYIAALATEYPGMLIPVTVDGTATSVVPANSFTAPSLAATSKADLVIYATALSLALGQQPVPPGDFTLVGFQPILQPNGLNGADPIMAVAYKNWDGKTTINSNWLAAGYNGCASMVAYRLTTLPSAPPGKTVVCIPSGVSCMVSPVAVDHQSQGLNFFDKTVVSPWGAASGTLSARGYGGMAYSLVMSDGVTLEIDGALIANPNASSAFARQWMLITNSAWLQNNVIGTRTVPSKFTSFPYTNFAGSPTVLGTWLNSVPWTNYLNGSAFNEGPRNSGIRIRGGGKVLLNGTLLSVASTLFSLVGLARFVCADDSSIDGLEIVNPFSVVVDWAHSDRAIVSDLYVHDGVSSWTTKSDPTTQAGSPVFVPTARTGQGFLTGFFFAVPAIVEMDMLRNSQVLEMRVVNCPGSIGTIEWAGSQNRIFGNIWKNCYGGYYYFDCGRDWSWGFGPPPFDLSTSSFVTLPVDPNSATYWGPNQAGLSYTNVQHNSEISQNTAVDCNAAPSNVQSMSSGIESPVVVSMDFGSVGFAFNAGVGAINEAVFTTLIATPLEDIIAPGTQPLPVTGTSFHDNIAQGNSVDLFVSKQTSFRSAVNNTFGGATTSGVDTSAPVSDGLNPVIGEVPVGVVNGSNVVFMLAHAPSPGTLVSVYVNGLLEFSPQDFTVSGKTITLVVAPNPGSTITVNYQYQSGQ